MDPEEAFTRHIENGGLFPFEEFVFDKTLKQTRMDRRDTVVDTLPQDTYFDFDNASGPLTVISSVKVEHKKFSKEPQSLILVMFNLIKAGGFGQETSESPGAGNLGSTEDSNLNLGKQAKKQAASSVLEVKKLQELKMLQTWESRPVVAEDKSGLPLLDDPLKYDVTNGLAFLRPADSIAPSLWAREGGDITTTIGRMEALLEGMFGPVSYTCDYCHHSCGEDDDIKRHLAVRQHPSASVTWEPKGGERAGYPLAVLLLPGAMRIDAPFRKIFPVCPVCQAVFLHILDCVAHAAQHGGVAGGFQLWTVTCTRTFKVANGDQVACPVCNREFLTVAGLVLHWMDTQHVRLQRDGEVVFFQCQASADCHFHCRFFEVMHHHVFSQHVTQGQGIIKMVVLGNPSCVRRLMPLFPYSSVVLDSDDPAADATQQGEDASSDKACLGMSAGGDASVQKKSVFATPCILKMLSSVIKSVKPFLCNTLGRHTEKYGQGLSQASDVQPEESKKSQEIADIKDNLKKISRLHMERKDLRKRTFESLNLPGGSFPIAPKLFKVANDSEKKNGENIVVAVPENKPYPLKENPLHNQVKEKFKPQRPSTDFEGNSVKHIQLRTDLEGNPLKTIQPGTDIEGNSVKTIQPETDRKGNPANSIQPKTDLDGKFAKVIQPRFDLKYNPAKSNLQSTDKSDPPVRSSEISQKASYEQRVCEECSKSCEVDTAADCAQREKESVHKVVENTQTCVELEEPLTADSFISQECFHKSISVVEEELLSKDPNFLTLESLNKSIGEIEEELMNCSHSYRSQNNNKEQDEECVSLESDPNYHSHEHPIEHTADLQKPGIDLQEQLVSCASFHNLNKEVEDSNLGLNKNLEELASKRIWQIEENPITPFQSYQEPLKVVGNVNTGQLLVECKQENVARDFGFRVQESEEKDQAECEESTVDTNMLSYIDKKFEKAERENECLAECKEKRSEEEIGSRAEENEVEGKTDFGSTDDTTLLYWDEQQFEESEWENELLKEDPSLPECDMNKTIEELAEELL